MLKLVGYSRSNEPVKVGVKYFSFKTPTGLFYLDVVDVELIIRDSISQVKKESEYAKFTDLFIAKGDAYFQTDKGSFFIEIDKFKIAKIWGYDEKAGHILLGSVGIPIKRILK